MAYKSLLETLLDAPLSISGTSVVVTNDIVFGNSIDIVNADGVIVNRKGTIREMVKVNITSNVVTFVKRWLTQASTYIEDPLLKKAWKKWDYLYITQLAPSILDKWDDNTFPGTQTFNNIIANGSVLVWWSLNVTWQYSWPVVSTTTARSILYPTPVTGNECYVIALNAKTIYNASTSQWDVQGVSTPAPAASESVAWIMPLANNAESLAGSNDTKAMTPFKTKAALDAIDRSQLQDATFMLGEDCVAWNSLFTETVPTFTAASLFQNLWDITDNAILSLPVLGTWVIWSTINLSLAKVLSPSANLYIRIETDTWWSPSGNLVDPNATATILPWSLTTSLVDTVVTFAWSFTVSKWTKVHIIIGVVWGVINATNYYKVWYSPNHTTTRGMLRFNSTYSFWNNYYATGSATTYTQTFSGNGSTSNISTCTQTCTFTVNSTCTITSVSCSTPAPASWLSLSSATIQSISWVVLTTWSIAWWVVTFSDFKLLSWNQYKIVIAGSYWTFAPNGWSYWAFPSWTYITVNSQTFTWPGAIVMSSILTKQLAVGNVNNSLFPYVSSTIFAPILLSLTDSDYSYKLPNDVIRISAETKTAWNNAKCTMFGINSNQTWLIPLTDYYISWTPWSISTIPWTNSFKVWKSISDTKLFVRWIIV